MTFINASDTHVEQERANPDSDPSPVLDQNKSERASSSALSLKGRVHARTGQPKHTTLFLFEPSIVVPGRKEQVVGALGHDLSSTLEVVRRAFPALRGIADERIHVEFKDVPLGVLVPSPSPSPDPVPSGALASAAPLEGADIDIDMHVDKDPGRSALADAPAAAAKLRRGVATATATAQGWTRVMHESWGVVLAQRPERVRVWVPPTVVEREEYDRTPIWAYFVFGALSILVAGLLIAVPPGKGKTGAQG